eukprot:767451-Hanusia_phi.AAC.2
MSLRRNEEKLELPPLKQHVPSSFNSHQDYEFASDGDAHDWLILANCQERVISFTGVIDLKSFGITPHMCRTLAKRLSKVSSEVHTIDLSANPIRMQGLVQLSEPISRFTRLSKLNLSSCMLSFSKSSASSNGEEAQLLKNFFDDVISPSLNLTILNLSKNNLGADGLKALHQTSSRRLLSNLTDLDISTCNLDHNSSFYTKQLLSNLSSLTRLNLADNSIRKTAAADVIAGLYKCTSLQVLDLSFNGFGGEKAAELLAKYLSKACVDNLRRINLSHNRFELVLSRDVPLTSSHRCGASECQIYLLASLYLARYSKSKQSYENVEFLESALDKYCKVGGMYEGMLASGQFRGSLATILSKLKRSSPLRLEFIDLSGNMLSNEAECLVSYLFSTLADGFRSPVDNFSNVTTKENSNFVWLESRADNSFPITSLRVNGYPVLRASPNKILCHNQKDFDPESVLPISVEFKCEVVSNVSKRVSTQISEEINRLQTRYDTVGDSCLTTKAIVEAVHVLTIKRDSDPLRFWDETILSVIERLHDQPFLHVKSDPPPNEVHEKPVKENNMQELLLLSLSNSFYKKHRQRVSRWFDVRKKLNFVDQDGRLPMADPLGLEVVPPAIPGLPSFACAQHVSILSKTCGEFVVAHAIDNSGSYLQHPLFYEGIPAPPNSMMMRSLEYRGDVLGVANLAVRYETSERFWNSLNKLRESLPSHRDNIFLASIDCPDMLVIGETFEFAYEYLDTESRIPDSFHSDYFALFKCNHKDEDVFDVKEDILLCKIRPPHPQRAQVQLRHVRWTPGTYRIVLFFMNSDTVIGRSPDFIVKFATASMSCAPEITLKAKQLEVQYSLDYPRCMHPDTDWIGVFPRDSNVHSEQDALFKCKVPPKNAGSAFMAINNLPVDEHYDVTYIQRIQDERIILGKTTIKVVPNPPEVQIKFERTSHRNQNDRNVRFYLSCSFDDMQEERNLIHNELMPRLRQFADAARVSITVVDLRFGVSEQMSGDLNQTLASSSRNLIEICLDELEKCLPYFLCFLGNIYGRVPKSIPSASAKSYPWLTDRRFHNMSIGFGARLSLTEMEVTNAILVQATNSPQARFYFRDQSYAHGRGSAFADSSDGSRLAMNSLKSRIRKAVDLSASKEPDRCMRIHQYFDPRSLLPVMQRDIIEIVEADFGDHPQESEAFWKDLRAVSSQHLHKLASQRDVHVRKLTELQAELDKWLGHEDVGNKVVVYGAKGSGKSCVLSYWLDKQMARFDKAATTNMEKNHYFQYFTHEGEETVVSIMAISCGLHHQLRRGYDVLRMITLNLRQRFEFKFEDENLKDEYITKALKDVLDSFPPHYNLIFALDGLDHLISPVNSVSWMPNTENHNVKWVVSTSDPNMTKLLCSSERKFLCIELEEFDEEQRRGMMESFTERYYIKMDQEVTESLLQLETFAVPENVQIFLDVLKLADDADGRKLLLDELLTMQTLPQYTSSLLGLYRQRQPKIDHFFHFLCLSETGLFENELCALMNVPLDMSCLSWLEMLDLVREVCYTYDGVWKMFDQSFARIYMQTAMSPSSRNEHLKLMETFFESMPTCNRKMDEFPFVLEKLGNQQGLEKLIIDIPFFLRMYSDPMRRLQYLRYVKDLGKTKDDLLLKLRDHFEDHFSISNRWFSNASLHSTTTVLHHELNPVIYQSEEQLMYFVDVIFHLSSLFEMYGRHEECIRDLEAGLKCLYGTADIFQIPSIHKQECRFPHKVVLFLSRLARLYTLHLRAMYDFWWGVDLARNIKNKVRKRHPLPPRPSSRSLSRFHPPAPYP